MPDFDPARSVFRSRPRALAALLAAREERARLWRPDELAAVFRHQMGAPVMVDLGSFDAPTAARIRSLSDAQGLLLKSFGELFRHPAPPVELLELTKDFAKLNLDHPESGLPTEITTALYYSSIAVALVRLDTRISQLKDADLRRGLLWVAAQPWVDAETKALMNRAVEKLTSGACPEDPVI